MSCSGLTKATEIQKDDTELLYVRDIPFCDEINVLMRFCIQKFREQTRITMFKPRRKHNVKKVELYCITL